MIFEMNKSDIFVVYKFREQFDNGDGICGGSDQCYDEDYKKLILPSGIEKECRRSLKYNNKIGFIFHGYTKVFM